MKHCGNCGVILNPEDEQCPLCGSSAEEGAPSSVESGRLVQQTDSEKRKEKDAALPTYPDNLTESEQGRIIVELISVAAGIALIVSILADLFSSGRLTWSLYSSIGIMTAWLFSAIPVMFYRKPIKLFLILAPALILVVFLFDLISGSLSWFLFYGLPVVLSLDLCVFGAGVMISKQKRHGLNTVAVFLVAIAAFCFLLESIIDLNLLGHLSPGWSVIVSFALIPTAGLLFYLHYRIMHRASLRKLFRL